jgi:hypothetical protein
MKATICRSLVGSATVYHIWRQRKDIKHGNRLRTGDKTEDYGKRETQKDKRELRDMLQLRINYQIKYSQNMRIRAVN